MSSKTETYRAILIAQEATEVPARPKLLFEGAYKPEERIMVATTGMAMEKAVVASSIGWAKEVLIDGQQGFTESPKAHEAYAEKVLRMINNKDLQESLGKAARKQILSKFSTKVVASKNIIYYKSLISNH